MYVILIWRQVTYKVCYWLSIQCLSCWYKVVRRLLTLTTQQISMDRSYPEMCFVFLIIKTFGILIYKKKMKWKKTFRSCYCLNFTAFLLAEIYRTITWCILSNDRASFLSEAKQILMFSYITGLAVGERLLSAAVPRVPGLSPRGLLPPTFDPVIQYLLHLDLCHTGL